MKTLLILRHAKASWKEPGMSDHDRPLDPRGERDAPRIGQLVKDRVPRPELVLSSSATRAHKTAQKVIEASGDEVALKLLPELYLATPSEHVEVLRFLDDDYRCVMVVAHNPGLEQLLEFLSGHHLRLPTGTLAQVELPTGRWSELTLETRGRLKNVWRPGELD